MQNDFKSLVQYHSLSLNEIELLYTMTVLPTDFYSLDTLQDFVNIEKQALEQSLQSLHTKNILYHTLIGYSLPSLQRDSIKAYAADQLTPIVTYIAKETEEKMLWYLDIVPDLSKIPFYAPIALEVITYQTVGLSHRIYLLFYLSLYAHFCHRHQEARHYTIEANRIFEKEGIGLPIEEQQMIRQELDNMIAYIIDAYVDYTAPYTEALQNYHLAPHHTALARQTVEAYHTYLQNIKDRSGYSLQPPHIVQIEAIVEAHTAEFIKNEDISVIVLQIYRETIAYYSRRTEAVELEDCFMKTNLYYKKYTEYRPTNPLIEAEMISICYAYLYFFKEDSSRTDLVPMIAENIALLRTRCQNNAENLDEKDTLARFYELQGIVHYNQTSLDRAEQSYLQAERIWQEILKKSPQDEVAKIMQTEVQRILSFIRKKLKK